MVRVTWLWWADDSGRMVGRVVGGLRLIMLSSAVDPDCNISRSSWFVMIEPCDSSSLTLTSCSGRDLVPLEDFVFFFFFFANYPSFFRVNIQDLCQPRTGIHLNEICISKFFVAAPAIFISPVDWLGASRWTLIDLPSMDVLLFFFFFFLGKIVFDRIWPQVIFFKKLNCF